MQEEVTYIVGDKFLNFAANKGVTTISKFLDMLNLPKSQIHSGHYVIGQGIAEYQEQSIFKKIKDFNLTDTISIRSFEYQRLTKKYSHKAKNENVMITEPIKIGTHKYRSQLKIDDKCAEMDDHITGHHLQGMVLIEAARQLMLAVSELYYLEPEQQGKMYFILHSIKTEFKAFMFPIESIVEYEVLEYTKKNSNLYSSIVTRFYQAEELKTEVFIIFSAYDANKMAEKEKNIAIKTINLNNNLLGFTTGLTCDYKFNKNEIIN